LGRMTFRVSHVPKESTQKCKGNEHCGICAAKSGTSLGV
jgi:hypothetical protein